MIFEYQGKTVFDGKTVEGFFHMIDGRTYITPFGTSVAKEVIPGTVRMFTGRRDRNGRKIYEYDVARFHIDDPEEDFCDSDYVVMWDKERCGFYVWWTRNAEEWDHIDPYFCENCTVIGNALEDPALAGVHRAAVETAKSQALQNLIEDVVGARDVESPSPTDETEEGDADGGTVV